MSGSFDLSTLDGRPVEFRADWSDDVIAATLKADGASLVVVPVQKRTLHVARAVTDPMIDIVLVDTGETLVRFNPLGSVELEQGDDLMFALWWMGLS